MAAKKDSEKVTLRHPSGNFTVTVTAARAGDLQKRGYTTSTSKGKK